MPENFYDLLGVSDDATQAELKSAYRAKAREYHPDVNDDDRATAQFQTIRRAYDVLSDESERADYERLGHTTYVKKRMKGYPSASRWGDDESTDASSSANASTSSSAASSRSNRSDTSKSATATNRSSTGTSSTTSRSSASTSSTASTGSAGATRSRSKQRSSRRSNGATGGGHDPEAADARARAREARRTRRRQQRRQNEARSSRRRTLLYHWTAVLGATILYAAGVGQFLLAQRAALEAFATELASAPSTAALTGAFGIGPTHEFVLAAAQAAPTMPTALLFPVGAVALPLSLVVTVHRFGKGATWLYAVGSFAPLVALGLSVALAPLVALTLLLVAVVPVLSASLFLGDVGRYLWATR